MAKKISPKKVSTTDLRSSIRGGVKSSGRLSYFNITEEEIQQHPEEVVKELAQSVALIPIAQIAPNPDQPRKDFDPAALQELADSIKTYGLIQPLTVRRLSQDDYQLISGERRWRASKLAGLEEVPAYVRIANDQEMMEMALVENIQRENLNGIEVAITYVRLIEEFNLTHEELANRIGKKRVTVTNMLRLLDLPTHIQEAIKAGKISAGHGKALASVDDFAMQQYFANKVIQEQISVRALEQLISQYKMPKAEKSAKNDLADDYKQVERSFREFFGVRDRLKLKLKEEGKGQIVIVFNSVKELNELLDRLE
ncbi:MAG TPA: ParB/RepB/Spo0J family partition protein [Saprospiraceae bacterium]|nr:ParB/RepB/Spo0J family partition protein [Saprospiraceae bacterium]HMQ82123.1 ParB/RepB/Spo0J family partition protein [Saprospiraceae bacterium]